jgi:hypothetical protein
MTINLKIRILFIGVGRVQDPRCPVRANEQTFVDVLLFINSYSAFNLGSKEYEEKEKRENPASQGLLF